MIVGAPLFTLFLIFRLGPFGFFYQDSGDSEAILGNFGILDQREALKWVQSFIRYLGGDPNEVTAVQDCF